jgi:PII-like signaling protein
MEDALKLTVYAGERDRAGGRLLSDALMDLYESHEVRASILMRGLEGFGIRHRLQTERLLTLSEDLPILAVALDAPSRIQSLMAEVRALTRHGLITLERAELLGEHDREPVPARSTGELKLTVHVGRQERADGRRAHLAVVDCLDRHGLAGASVLLGVDGTAHGRRYRARFMASNSEVPVMIVSVGASAAIANALPELHSILARPMMTLERVQVCKRDGVLLGAPTTVPSPDEAGMARWQKLTVYASERSRHGHEPLHGALIRRLRAEGAAGATALRGLWGYHGEHRPHGERFWSLARHVPVLGVLLDTQANMARWFEIVDELTQQTGLVTSEIVPALRAAGPEVVHGGLELAARHGDARNI